MCSVNEKTATLRAHAMPGCCDVVVRSAPTAVGTKLCTKCSSRLRFDRSRVILIARVLALLALFLGFCIALGTFFELVRSDVCQDGLVVLEASRAETRCLENNVSLIETVFECPLQDGTEVDVSIARTTPWKSMAECDAFSRQTVTKSQMETFRKRDCRYGREVVEPCLFETRIYILGLWGLMFSSVTVMFCSICVQAISWTLDDGLVSLRCKRRSAEVAPYSGESTVSDGDLTS